MPKLETPSWRKSSVVSISESWKSSSRLIIDLIRLMSKSLKRFTQLSEKLKKRLALISKSFVWPTSSFRLIKLYCVIKIKIKSTSYQVYQEAQQMN